MSITLRIFSFITILIIPYTSIAESATTRPVKLSNGINSLDFTGDGISDLVVIGHRENFNAHSFDIASFYISFQPEGGGAKQWDIVPLMGKNNEKFQVTISGGADCVLHDFRLIAGSGKTPTRLILADRDMGESYADSEKVTFTYFTLVTRKESIAGFPPYSFERTHVKTSNVSYCDVSEAFQKELGIGKYFQ